MKSTLTELLAKLKSMLNSAISYLFKDRQPAELTLEDEQDK